MWKEGVDVSITGNSTNPTRFQHPVAGTYKKECIEAGQEVLLCCIRRRHRHVPFIRTTWQQDRLPTV